MVQGRRDSAKAGDPGGLDLTDDGQDVGRELIGSRDLGSSPVGTRSREIRIAQPSALGSLGSEGSRGPLRDQPTLLLGQSGVEVEHKGIGICSELGNDERTFRAMRLAMKATSRESLSSLATTTGHFARRARSRAAASFGRRSRASWPLPVSISTNSAAI